MQKQELDKSIDLALSEEFDALIFQEFCSKVEAHIQFLKTSNEYSLRPSRSEVLRSIEVMVADRIYFSKLVSQGQTNSPASVMIQQQGPHSKFQYSFTDLCAIFYPENKFSMTENWKKTLQGNLQALTADLANLFEKEIAVAISDDDRRDQRAPFWSQPGIKTKHQFYAYAEPVLKFIVTKAVPEISIAARWGSDSPYQRFLTSEHWGLISFRFSRRQQVDIAQYGDSKKLRWKCALIDLGFLENGYGKVAKIKELISMDVAMDSPSEKIAACQEEFIDRVLKQLSGLIP